MDAYYDDSEPALSSMSRCAAERHSSKVRRQTGEHHQCLSRGHRSQTSALSTALDVPALGMRVHTIDRKRTRAPSIRQWTHFRQMNRAVICVSNHKQMVWEEIWM
jgi:hypothetical protein